MAYQTILPTALTRRGLAVETVPGWETRGSSTFSPGGAICHWTAGPPRSVTRPSLNICVNGRAGLPGPLCNVYLDRKGVAVVVAAGRGNHAGVGNWRGLTSNSQLFGTEAEAANVTDFTDAQRIAYPKVNAAFADIGGFGAPMVAGHSEFALPKGRKVDINGYTMDDMRSAVAAILAGKTGPSTELPEVLEDDMPKLISAEGRGHALLWGGFVTYLPGGSGVDQERLANAQAMYGPITPLSTRDFDLAVANHEQGRLSPASVDQIARRVIELTNPA